MHESLSQWLGGFLHGWQGEYVIASQHTSEGVRIAREHNLLLPLLFNLFNYGLTLTGMGNYDEAFGILQEGLALSEKVGDEIMVKVIDIDNMGKIKLTRRAV